MNKTKICGKCKENKDTSLFSKRTKSLDGLQPFCKSCAHPLRTQWARDNKEMVRGYVLKYKYGLTHEKVDAMLEEQNNACKICKVEFIRTPHIDHDHSCCGPTKACNKCVRGLLCSRCNIFIGYFENYEYMDEVKKYLDLTIETD